MTTWPLARLRHDAHGLDTPVTDAGPDLSVAWNTLNRGKWDALIAKAGAPVQQDWAYGEAMTHFGAQVLRAVVTNADGRTLAIAQVTARNFAVARWSDCTRGPVWLTPLTPGEKAAVITALRRQIPLARPRCTAFTPNDEAHETAFAKAKLTRVFTGMHAMTLDLNADLDTLRRRTKSKWRNRLRAAEKATITVTAPKAKPKTLEWIIGVEKRQQIDKGYAGLPGAFVLAYRDAARRASSVRMWQAEIDGEIAAVMVFLRHADQATYHLGWSSPPARKVNASNLLLWRAIEAFHHEGVRQIDLGVADTETSPGLARFKLGAGAGVRSLVGTYL